MALDRIVNLRRLGLPRWKPSAAALADQARDRGQWGVAAELYRKALNRNPRNPPIWVQYGHALKESGERRDPDKLAQAESAYRRALSLNPGIADTHVQLGHVLKLQGKAEEAQAAYLRAFGFDLSVPYLLQELSGLGWSETHIGELQRLLGDARKPHAAATASWSAVTHAEIRCVKTPSFSHEVALFVTHSPHGRLKPHVYHYLESLKRQDISVVLIVNADRSFEAVDVNFASEIDGVFVRQNEGYDFGAWAHVLRLHPELFDAEILYLLNDSVIGPTNDIAFRNILTRLRNSPADVVGLTENFDRAWHVQSYFLALKHRALSSAELRKFINGIVSYRDIEDVINEFEVRFASIVKAAGLNCEAMFPATDVRDPTIYHWKRLLESGFPFVKVKTLRDILAGVDISDWHQLLATQGYDVSLAELTLAQFSTFSTAATGGRTLGITSPQQLTGEYDVLTEDHRVIRWFNLKRRKRSVTALADRARDSGQWELAAQLYRKALHRNPQSQAIWVQYGHVLKESGELRDPDMLAQAETAYRRALSLNPGAADPHLQLGHVLKLQGKTEEAAAAYLRAFALDPSTPYPLQELSGLGWSEDQMAALRGLVGSSSTPPATSTSKATSRADVHTGANGSRGDSNPPRRGLIGRRPSAIVLADGARDAWQWERAAQLYRKALNRNPRNPGIWVQYGHALKECGELRNPEKLAQAEMAYRRAVSLDPSVADTYLQLGHVLKLQGKREEAEAAYLRAFALDPSMPYPLQELSGLGWSETHMVELKSFLADGSPVNGPSVAGNGQSHPTAGDGDQETERDILAEDHGRIREGRGTSVNHSPDIVKTLFPGSVFSELSVTSGAEAVKFMVKSATPAAQLARPSPEKYSPRISIILPIYNTAAGYFREVTQSIFAQTYTNWELCIVDDGSRSEETITIRRELERSSDSRIKVLTLPENRGIAEASHAALLRATGDYVAFVDHDDLITPNAFSEVVALLREDPTVDYVYTDHAMADQDGLPTSVSSKPEWSPEFLLSTNYIVHLKVVRRSLLVSAGGLAQEVSHVQDLGMSWRLVEANARIAHLQKPVYLWREHENSVASTTEAKPGIENLLVDVYDRHLCHLGASASQTWPQPFRRSRVGVFRLDFKKITVPTSLVVFMKSDFERTEEIRARIGRDIVNRIRIHFVSLGHHRTNEEEVRWFTEHAELTEFLASLNTEFVVFINSTARFITPKWLDDIVGYLTLDERIGAVGGKVLDEYLRVRAGGLLVDRNGNYKTICGGEFDNSPGHWWIGQVASNVDAVSSQLLAARVKVLLASGGVRFREYEDAWSVGFSQYLRENDFRIVYNPFSKIFDPGRIFISKEARERIAAVGRAASTKRYYAAL
jgi:tetratricopeptide (TPR) repeat protein